MFKKIYLSIGATVQSGLTRCLKRWLLISLVLMGGVTHGYCLQTTAASYPSAAYRSDLISMINVLQRLKPMIANAKENAPKHSAVQVHFYNFVDNAGIKHHGMYEDINAIQQSLIQVLNHTPTEPRPITPLKADFVTGLSR